ncbi:MAG: endonuclease/exonuclease/phosphatase family protein [Patescibacteria group bacterium]
MKLITLNTWGGKIYKPLEDFIQRYQDVDIFCFQEIYHDAVGKEKDEDFLDSAFNLFTDLQKLLPNHLGFFKENAGGYYGNCIFIKNNLSILEEGDHFVYKHKGYIPEGDFFANHARNLQFVKTKNKEITFNIFNVHGLWNGNGKTDTEDRINQSKNILEFIKKFQNEFILCGDFNLRLDTESIKILEDSGLRNLIRENNVTNTRTSLYKKEERFADYIFVTKDIIVKDFKVLPDEVSDHSPLFLDFELK